MSIGFEFETPIPLVYKEDAKQRAAEATSSFGKNMGGKWAGSLKTKKREKVENEIWKLVALSRGFGYQRNISNLDILTTPYYNVDHSNNMVGISKRASWILENAQLFNSALLEKNKPDGKSRGAIVEFVTPPYPIHKALNVDDKLNAVQTTIQNNNAKYSDEDANFSDLNELKISAEAINQTKVTGTDKVSQEAAAKAMADYNTALTNYSDGFNSIYPQATVGLTGKGVMETVQAAADGPITKHAKVDNVDSGRRKITQFAIDGAKKIVDSLSSAPGLTEKDADYVKEISTMGALNFMGTVFISSNSWQGGTTIKNAIPLLVQTSEQVLRDQRQYDGVNFHEIAKHLTTEKIKGVLNTSSFNLSAKEIADTELGGIKDPSKKLLTGDPLEILGKDWLSEHLSSGVSTGDWQNIILRGGGSAGLSDLTDSSSRQVGRYEIRTLNNWTIADIAQNAEDIRQELDGRN